MFAKRIVVALVLFTTGCGDPTPDQKTEIEPAAKVPAGGYFIRLDAQPISAEKVEFIVKTNAPLPIEAMADVTLTGLKDDETWIGEEERVTLDQPETKFVLDTSKNGKRLPSGKYIAEVDYFQRWGAEINPAARDVPDMSDRQEIHLAGSGEGASRARDKAAMQRWVMGEMDFVRPWTDAELRSKLGQFERYDSQNAVNSVVYYFPDADISLFVDPRRHKVFTAKMGRVP